MFKKKNYQENAAANVTKGSIIQQHLVKMNKITAEQTKFRRENSGASASSPAVLPGRSEEKGVAGFWLAGSHQADVSHGVNIFGRLAPSCLGVGCKAMLLADGGVKGCTPNRKRCSVKLCTNRITQETESVFLSNTIRAAGKQRLTKLWSLHKTFCEGCRTVRYLQRVHRLSVTLRADTDTC